MHSLVHKLLFVLNDILMMHGVTLMFGYIFCSKTLSFASRSNGSTEVSSDHNIFFWKPLELLAWPFRKLYCKKLMMLLSFLQVLLFQPWALHLPQCCSRAHLPVLYRHSLWSDLGPVCFMPHIFHFLITDVTVLQGKTKALLIFL